MIIEDGLPKFYLPNYLKDEKNKLYFVADKIYNNRILYDYYNQSEKLIKNQNCNKIGFNSGGTNIEYPLWVILKDYYKNTKFEMHNVNIDNKSAYLKSDNNKLCAIINVDKLKLF